MRLVERAKLRMNDPAQRVETFRAGHVLQTNLCNLPSEIE